MRVLVVTKDFPAPGQPEGGIVVARQLRALQEAGHELRVVRLTPHAPGITRRWRAYRDVPTEYAVDGIAVATLRAYFPPRLIGMEFLPLQLGRAIDRLVEEFRPDLIHAHYVIPSGQLAVRRAVPAVVTAHGSDAYDWPGRRPGLRRAAAYAVREAAAVVAVSQFIAGHVRDLAARDVDVVYNGADEEIFAPGDRSAAREAMGIAPDRFAIAFAGRVSAAKGAFDLLDAAARLADLRPLLLVAGTTDGGALRRIGGRPGVEVRTLGMLSHRELARALAAADVFCLPSYREGLPLAVCEAMLAARPVVATPVGGIPEIVNEGRFGYLVPPGDVAQLAKRLRGLAERPDAAGEMGRAAHEFARRHLTWRVNVRRYEEIYRRAIETRPPPQPNTNAACMA